MVKVVIIGYARHGKDEVGRLLCQHYPQLRVPNTSYVAAVEIVYPALHGEYACVAECYNDRHNRRADWFRLIGDYNAQDPARFAKMILRDHGDVYIGLRSQVSLAQVRPLVSLVVWVDASRRLKTKESESSCTVTAEMADIVVDNNGSLAELEERVLDLIQNKLKQYK